MRHPWLISLVAIGCGAPAATPVSPPAPAEHRGAIVEPEEVVRGSYVAALAGCVTCHSPMRDDGKPGPARLLSGSEGKLADGSVWRAPNITLDIRSGIGMWSDAQIVAAIRQGVRPDG